MINIYENVGGEEIVVDEETGKLQKKKFEHDKPDEKEEMPP